MRFSTLDQLFIPARIFQSAWEFAQAVYLFCGLWEDNNRKRPILYSLVGFFVQNRRVPVVDGFHFGGLRILSLLFAVFLLASSSGGLLLALNQCTVRQCEAGEWKDIQGQDHDSQPEKVDVPSPGPGQVTTPDGVVQVFWGLFHEYGESGAWDWQMDWGSINDVETVHSFQSIRFELLDAARHQLWKTTYCCCHLLQHLKGSHNVHSTVRCFLLISPFFMGVFPPEYVSATLGFLLFLSCFFMVSKSCHWNNRRSLWG